MHRKIQLEVGTKVFLRNTEGEFLLLKRARPYAGEDFCRWDIPGGRIHAGETQLEALQREVYEETGLQLSPTIELLGVQDILKQKDKHTVRVTYLGVVQEMKEITLDPEEHSTYKWFSLEALQETQHDPFLDSVIVKLQ